MMPRKCEKADSPIYLTMKKISEIIDTHQSRATAISVGEDITSPEVQCRAPIGIFEFNPSKAQSIRFRSEVVPTPCEYVS